MPKHDFKNILSVDLLDIARFVFGLLNKVPQFLSFWKNVTNKPCSEHVISIKKWSQNCILGENQFSEFLCCYIQNSKNPKIDFDPKMQF